MSIKAIIPSPPEIMREAVIVLAGALLATLVIKSLPVDWQNLFTLPGRQQ